MAGRAGPALSDGHAAISWLNRREDREMAYFDRLTAAACKTTQDGRRLFFPWDTSGRSYVIVSEQDYKLLQKQMKTYIVVSLVLMMGGIVLQSYLIAFGSLIIFTAF